MKIILDESVPQKLRLLIELVLSTNNWDRIKAGVAQVLSALENVRPGSYAEAEIPE